MTSLLMPHLVSSLGPTFGTLVCADRPTIPPPEGVWDLLDRSGAVLFRVFGFTPGSFVSFSDSCCSAFSTYVGGAFRFRSLDRVSLGAHGTLLSPTGATQAFAIPLHGEMYYQKDRPETLWFFCNRAPSKRGQTTLADGREIMNTLSYQSKALLRSHELLYIRELH